MSCECTQVLSTLHNPENTTFLVEIHNLHFANLLSRGPRPRLWISCMQMQYYPTFFQSLLNIFDSEISEILFFVLENKDYQYTACDNIIRLLKYILYAQGTRAFSFIAPSQLDYSTQRTQLGVSLCEVRDQESFEAVDSRLMQYSIHDTIRLVVYGHIK